VAENSVERRSHPRVKADIAGHILHAEAEETFTIKTFNISRAGLYCCIARYVPPMTQLHIAMILPLRTNGRTRNELLEFEGVVVRTEPQEKRPDTTDYRIAVFFSGLEGKGLSLLA